MNTNHHLSKPAMIGKLDASGTFDVVWRSINPIKAGLEQIHSRERKAHRRLDFSLGLRGMCRADIQGVVTVSAFSGDAAGLPFMRPKI